MNDAGTALVRNVVVLAHDERFVAFGEEAEHGLVLQTHQRRPFHHLQLCGRADAAERTVEGVETRTKNSWALKTKKSSVGATHSIATESMLE